MRKLLAVSILAALVAGCSQTPEEKLESLNAKVLAQIDEYQFEAARSTIEEIGQLDPASPLILYSRGLILERQLCYQDAAHEYMLVATVDPEYAPALEGVCRSFFRLNEYAFAVRAASDLVKLGPADPARHLLLAEARIGLGQIVAAEREVSSAAKMGASASVTNLWMARLLHLRNEIDTARVIRQEVMKDLPETVECLQGAADLYEVIGQIDSSVVFSRRAVAAAPDNHEIILDHFHRCVRLRYFYDAQLAIADIKSGDGGEIVRAGMLVRYYRAAGQRPQARRAANDYRRLTDVSLMSVFFDIHARAEGYDLTSASSDLETVQGMIVRGEYLDEFKQYMNYTLVAHIPSDFAGEENLKALQELPTLYANLLEVKLKIAHIMHKIGDFEGYRELVSLLEEYHRLQPDWLTGIANLNSDPGVRKYDLAERLYTRVLEIDHWYRPAFEGMVAMHRRLQQNSKALAVFVEYPHFEQTYPLVRMNKALLLAENGQLEEALTIMTDNYMLAKGDLSFLRQILDIADSKGNVETVRRARDLLLALESDAFALHLAAVWSCKLGDYQQGLDLSERALSMDDDAGGYAIKAWALHGLGRKGEAFDLLEEIQARGHNSPAVSQYHSYLLASDGIDLDRASNFARKAVFDSHSDLKVWMNLCFVYYQAGRFDLCRGEALKASHSFTNQPVPPYWIGMAMEQEGNEEAKEYLQKAIMLGLVGDKLEKAQELVEKL